MKYVFIHFLKLQNVVSRLIGHKKTHFYYQKNVFFYFFFLKLSFPAPEYTCFRCDNCRNLINSPFAHKKKETKNDCTIKINNIYALTHLIRTVLHFYNIFMSIVIVNLQQDFHSNTKCGNK